MKDREETEFGQMLRKYRSRNHVSQADLASTIGVSTNTIHLWETRKCRPEMGSMQRLADVMDEPLMKLLEIAGH